MLHIKNFLFVDLGSATSFAILAGTTITSTGAKVATGDVGLFPGSEITGFPPATVVQGQTFIANTESSAAHSGLATAYGYAAGLPSTVSLAGDLGGQTLASGVYKSTSGLSITGILRLTGNATAVFIFQITSALVVASGGSVILVGGALPCNVFWQVSDRAIGRTQ